MLTAAPSMLAVLYLTLLLDLALGDPPNRYHPVAWMGALIVAMRRLAESRSRLPWSKCAWGVGLVVAGLTVSIAAGCLIDVGLARLPRIAGWLGEALVLKMTFSLRGLAHAARRVGRSLEAGDLAGARGWLYQHLVSRETGELDESAIAAAAVESVAENASDSVVAPLLYYALAGLPGALAYRFVNTADALIGYRDPRHEWLGRPAARLDDLLNLVPARLTAFLMMPAAPLVGGSPARGWAIWWRDARLTASPNAGQPMSVAAGVLGVELEKTGHYRLGSGLAAATPRDISRAVRLLYATVGCLVISITLLAWLWQR
ncbi:MAG TPA: adenosylcobinamide-phosphate synthase CbiB [Pirellulales bacterium]|jgi:adenosylcobinamide-phosphate synthase|nr:adenosylcobinamide-phosphate synthase CbiB [Pirellulales bacterium]